MTITASDIGGEGASDYITLGMCSDCNDSFSFGEDEEDLPVPPGYYTDISFFNFDWIGVEYGDPNNPVFLDNPEFYIDKKSFHEPADLLIWNINGFTNLPNENSPIEISWNLDELAELSADYEIYLYIGDSSYDMRNISNVVITEEQLLIQQSTSGEFISNIQVVIGGCAEDGNIADYYYDQDGDGFGSGLASEFCVGEEPDGWVGDDGDINDSIYCLSNIIDGCDVCDGENLCIGCSEPDACNYSELVTEDDSSCYYAEDYYDCDGNCILDSDEDNVCDELEVLGCTDIIACNYNDEATEDDGSCEYPDVYYDCNGDCIFDLDDDGVCDELEIFGCANSASCFFDSNATEHDGSCCAEEDNSCEEAPGEIENLYVQVNSNSVTIDFDQPCGVTLAYWSYRLLEDLNDPGIVIPSPYTITGLDWGTSYTYYLKVFNSAGNSVTEINFTTENEPLPDDIVNLSYEPGEGYVSLEWTSIDNANTYNIIRNDEIIATVDGQMTNYIDDGVYYQASLYYNYAIQGVNSQGVQGNISSYISVQPSPIPSITEFSSFPGAGSILFSWDSPASYASISDYTFRIQSMGVVIDDNYNDFEYTLYELSFEEEVCLGVQAIHQYGESDIQLICDFAEMPYPPEVSDFIAIGQEGYVSLTWSMIGEPNHLVNIYRDQQLIESNLNTLENPPPYINDIYDGYGMLAGQLYSYQISASNSELLEGELSIPVVATTLPLPLISDLEASPSNGRVALSWSQLDEYAGFGYTYEVIDASNNSILETSNSYATVSDLVPGEEYCFYIKAHSLGGYGESDYSNLACAIPDNVFDGTADDNNIDWGIQLSVDLLRPSGQIISDTQNMLGVAQNATDLCDPDFDIGEAVDPPNSFVKLYFPHPEWTCGLDAGGRYNNDIRSQYSSSNTIKEWEVTLATDIYEQNIATLSFYFYENAGGNTAYYTIDDENYIKINNGEPIEYGLLTPASEGSFKVIVGDIVPEAPVNVYSEPNFREVGLFWTDGYIPGSLTYESLSYNIYRNGELIGNTEELSFTDRGLGFSSEYQYQIQGVNIAGEGPLSSPINITTLENRRPDSNAGDNLIIYDVSDDNLPNSQFSLPMTSTNLNGISPLLLLENLSYDPDNYSDAGPYNPPLDQLSYTWESLDNVSNSEIYNVNSYGYGVKAFTLEVNDGYIDSNKDSVYVKVMPMPVPAKVYVDTLYSGLYSIDIEWVESNYTGEPYAKFAINSDILSFEEGDSFEDLNGNGIYDSGINPLPPFYGLSNLNNPEGYKNIAEYYEVEVNGDIIGSVSEACTTNSEDTYLSEYCYNITGLDPSTEYSIIVRSCNFNDSCSDSEVINVSTGYSPHVEVIYPNGAEIVGIEDDLNVELSFSGYRYVDSLSLSLLIDDIPVSNAVFSTVDLDAVGDNYIIPLSALSFNSTLNSNSKVQASIVDEGGFDYLSKPDYYDVSDNSFIIASNTISQNFNNGWNLIGTPVILDSSITYNINNGIGFDSQIYWQIIDEDEISTGPFDDSDHVFKSGKGYYLNLYSGSPLSDEDFSETLSLSGDVVTEYTIDNLHAGWNLISNPLVISMNINNVDIVMGDGRLMNWEEAISEGLIAPYLLELNNQDNTLYPVYEIEPYKGYWLYLYEEVALDFKSTVYLEDDLSEDLLSTDFIINLSSRAFGQGISSFGSSIQLGYAVDASNEFINGIDIPYLDYQYFPEYTSMYIDNGEFSEHSKLSRDIREHYQPSYVWNIVGSEQAIYDPVGNPYTEIELFWDISDIDSNYTIALQYGDSFENQTDMREFNYVKLNNSQFANMRILVELQNYFSGCAEVNACNYFCTDRPWECPGGDLPLNFVDDNSCDLLSCVGCMDPLSSNFNPVATVDSTCEGGEYDGFSCMHDSEICGDSGSCINQVCEYNESFQFPFADEKIYIENNLTNTVPIYLNNYNNTPVYGVEIELSFDNSMVDISPISLLENSIIEDYSVISYVNQDNNIFHFVAYSPYPIFSSGLLFELEIDAIGEVGDITSIVFNKSILNDVSIANNSLNLVLSEGLLDLEGEIGYYSNINIPIESVEFNLIGYSDYNNPYSLSVVDTISVLSSNSGNYVFESALKGLYIMQASKFEPIGSSEGLSAVDASRIARYLIDLIDFNEDQVLAADVDMNGIVSAVDAAFVARYLIGLVDQLNGFNQHWRFRASDNFNLNVIDSSNFSLNLYDLRPLDIDLGDQDVVGIRIGDVDGSWISDAQSRKVYFENSVELYVDPNKLLGLPIAISQDQLIEGIELNIKYDHDKFLFDNLQLSDKITDYNVMVNDIVPGEISIIIYASSFIEDIDDIFGEASFILLDDEFDSSIISLDKILINGKDVESGFLILDDVLDEYIYSRHLNISTSSHPERFELGVSYPNPFNPTTKIPFAIPVESNVNIVIFDISGRFVDEIISGNISPGNHVAVFNGQNLASGLYIVKMQATPIAEGRSFSQSSKVILLK